MINANAKILSKWWVGYRKGIQEAQNNTLVPKFTSVTNVCALEQQ